MGASSPPLRSRGRPSLYDPDYCDRVLDLAGEGCGRAEIAAALQVNAKTIAAWTRAHFEFRDAMHHAKEIEYAWWLTKGREGHLKSGWNATGWALQMRNRFGDRFTDKLPSARPRGRASRGGTPNPVTTIAAPHDFMNAEVVRDEIERKLSRIADACTAESVSQGVDGEGAGSPEV